MNLTEATIYALVGCSSGIAISFGFLLQMLRVFYIDGAGLVRAILYHALMMPTCIAVGTAPIFVIYGFVMNKGWEDANAWPRLLAFAFGVLVGLTTAIVTAHLVFRKINELRGVSKT